MRANTIQAIETRYAGCRFRSRLEARWAVFFDQLGVEWMYEPQGYMVERLPGMRWRKRRRPYLPDFWLPKQRIWFEVKGSEHSPGFDLWEAFARAADPWDYDETGLPEEDRLPRVPRLPRDERGLCVLAYGDIPLLGERSGDSMLVFGDYNYLWCRCDRCGVFGAEHCGRIERLPCLCYQANGKDLSYKTNHDLVLAEAYYAARSARFEHRG